MASIRVLVVDDHVALWVRQILTSTGEPFAGALAPQALPFPVDERELMVLLQEGPESGQRSAEWRPLMLLGALAVVGLSPAATLETGIVFTKILNVVTQTAASFLARAPTRAPCARSACASPARRARTTHPPPRR